MKKIDFFLYCLKNDYLKDLKFVHSILGIMLEGNENKYLLLKDGKLTIKETNEVIEDYVLDSPLYNHYDKLTIKANFLNSVTENIVTTVGLAILNYFLIELPFKGKIPYTNKVDIGSLEGEIANRLQNNKPNSIEVKEWGMFIENAIDLEQLNKYLVVSATEKNIQPAKGIKKFREKLKKEFEEEHGEKWNNDPVLVAKFDKKLIEFDEDYLKDDPSSGIMASGKITNVARKNMFGSISGLDNTLNEEDGVFVDNSLGDSFKKDLKVFSEMVNESIEGSFARGAETMYGGKEAKQIIRALSSIRIVKEDCNSKQYKTVTINKDIYSGYVGRYYYDGSLKQIEDIKQAEKLIGKTIKLRTPKYCKSHTGTRCSVCMGELMSLKPDGLVILGTEVSDVITAAFMKKMHGGALKTTEIDLEDLT